MFSPRAKRLIFKILASIFLPDRHTVYRQYVETRIVRRELKEFFKEVSPSDLQEAKLHHMVEQMSDLQKAIYRLCEKGLTDKMIARKLNVPLRRIQKHLNLIKQELNRLSRYTK